MASSSLADTTPRRTLLLPKHSALNFGDCSTRDSCEEERHAETERGRETVGETERGRETVGGTERGRETVDETERHAETEQDREAC